MFQRFERFQTKKSKQLVSENIKSQRKLALHNLDCEIKRAKIPENQIQAALSLMKKEVRKIIPTDFDFWVEMNSDISISLSWEWNGGNSDVYRGRISDYDFGIILRRLESVNWVKEIESYFDTIRDSEIAALNISQKI